MEIMFDDLNEDAQQRLLDEAGARYPEEMDWDSILVAVVEFEADEYEDNDDLIDEDLIDEAYELSGDDTLD